jgi:tRNA nucleotidyltransferase (CCA-adding enzyme)
VEIRALSESENAVAALEAYDRLGLLKPISAALTGAKLNAAGLTRFEKLLHTVPPPGTKGGWLSFLTVLTEKLSPKEKADLLRAFDLPKKETEALKKLEAQAKKLESALKSARITKPSHVYDALRDATTDEVLMVLYGSAQRVVQDRIRAYYQKYLPLGLEITEELVAATGVKPGTPKFEKAFRNMVTTHLNARPKKIPPPEPDAVAAPQTQMEMGRGARK